MSKYTINDVANIIPAEQTRTTTVAVEEYLNNGTIPDYDPCLSCEPNHIRKLISLIQVAERSGLWPPARTEEKPKPKTEKVKEGGKVIQVNDNPIDPDVNFAEIFGVGEQEK